MSEKSSKHSWKIVTMSCFSFFQTSLSISQTWHLRMWISITAFCLCLCILNWTQNAKKFLNRQFHGSRALLNVVYSLHTLVPLLKWSITWAPGGTRLKARRPTPPGLLSQPSEKAHDRDLSWSENTWAARNCHCTGSIVSSTDMITNIILLCNLCKMGGMMAGVNSRQLGVHREHTDATC